jgi:hypothetical protein
MIEIVLITLGTIIVIEFLAKLETAYKEAERPENHENR